MTAIPGVDYSSGHPGGAALKAAGKAFAARYVSHTPSKNVSLAEAADLAAHGVSTVVVWETAANRAGAGRAAGIADAHDAVAQATAAGMPGDRPIYFAVDWDADPTVVVGYFQGVASVLGLPRVGGYGGYKVIKYLLDHGLITYGWQTAAWSQGKQDPRAHIYQPATGVHINGVACDDDTAIQTDYGQWTPGKSPFVEDSTVTKDEILAIAKEAAHQTWIYQWASPTDPKKGTRMMGTFLAYNDAQTASLQAAISAGTAATVKALAPLIGSGVDTDQVIEALKNMVIKVEVTGVPAEPSPVAPTP